MAGLIQDYHDLERGCYTYTDHTTDIAGTGAGTAVTQSEEDGMIGAAGDERVKKVVLPSF